MKQKYQELPEGNELELLRNQLDENEIFILSYLKGYKTGDIKQIENDSTSGI